MVNCYPWVVLNLFPKRLLVRACLFQQRVKANQNSAVGTFSEVQSTRLDLAEDSSVAHIGDGGGFTRPEHPDCGAAFLAPAFSSPALSDDQKPLVLDGNLHSSGPSHLASRPGVCGAHAAAFRARHPTVAIVSLKRFR